MATAGVMDFWRRRKIFIILGLIALIVLAGLIHIRSARRHAQSGLKERKKDSTMAKAVLKQKNPGHNHNKPGSHQKSASKKVKALPAIFNKDRFKQRSKGKLSPGERFDARKGEGRAVGMDDSFFSKGKGEKDYFAEDVFGKDGLFDDGKKKGVFEEVEGEAPLDGDIDVKKVLDKKKKDKGADFREPAIPTKSPDLPDESQPNDKAPPPINQGQFHPNNPANQVDRSPHELNPDPAGGNQGTLDKNVDQVDQVSRQGQPIPNQNGNQPLRQNVDQPNPNLNGNQDGNMANPNWNRNQNGNMANPNWNRNQNGNMANPNWNRNKNGNMGNPNWNNNQNGNPANPNWNGNQPPNPPGQTGNQLNPQDGNQPLYPANVPQNGNAPPENGGAAPVNGGGPMGGRGPLAGGGGVGGGQNGASSNMYVHSTMPVGQPLSIHHTERQEAVVRVFQSAWKAYVDYAWGKDEVNPVSHTSNNNGFAMGMTLVDTLDTLWLMGLRDDFQKARDWVAQSLNFDRPMRSVSTFETTIRVLGGLLSAYHLSGDRVFLDKATQLGDKLLPAFRTPSGIPGNLVTIPTGDHNSRTITVAEAGTLQLEFRDLSRASGNPAYQQACDKAMDKILSQGQGIVKQTLNCASGAFSGSIYTAGAGTDSYYEYLLKQWIQSARTEEKFRTAYEGSTRDVLRYLVGYTRPSHMAFLGKRFSLSPGGMPSPVMDHLSCFYPGMLALGVIYDVRPGDRAMAENLTHTCYYMYNSTEPTGLAPEIFQFNTSPGSTMDAPHSGDAHNFQRPETVESLFYLYRLTKQDRYREWGWNILRSFEKYTQLQGGGYTGMNSVFSPGSYRDRTESFFLTETLKYLFLLFGEDDTVLDLREWVFNTEAHPLPIWKMA